LEEKIFVAEYGVKLLSEDDIKKGLRATSDDEGLP